MLQFLIIIYSFVLRFQILMSLKNQVSIKLVLPEFTDIFNCVQVLII